MSERAKRKEERERTTQRELKRKKKKREKGKEKGKKEYKCVRAGIDIRCLQQTRANASAAMRASDSIRRYAESSECV